MTNQKGTIKIENLEQMSFGELCSLLAEANIEIYKYENKKWFGRSEKDASSQEIDIWDEASRSWNEKRSKIKNRIDTVLKEMVVSSNLQKSLPLRRKNNKTSYSFQVLPISLMIDMLTIENIKFFDLANKGNTEGVLKAKARKGELQKIVDEAVSHVVQTGEYKLQPEVRTF